MPIWTVFNWKLLQYCATFVLKCISNSETQTLEIQAVYDSNLEMKQMKNPIL